MSRSRLLGPVAFLVLLLLVAATVIAPAGNRSYSAPRYALSIDGADVGMVSSYSGCRATGEVTTSIVGTEQATEKRITGLRYEPCALVLGPNMRPAVYDWIREAFELKHTRKSVMISVLDHNARETGRIELRDAIITGVTLPALDASSKDAATITLTLTPEAMVALKGSNAPISATSATKSPAWLVSSFRVDLNGVPQAGVARMSPIEFTVDTATDTIGATRDATRAPSQASWSDVSVTVSSARPGDFPQWADDFLVQGNSQDTRERSLKVTYLKPNLKDALFEVTLGGVGIFGGDIFFPATTSGAGDSVARETYLLYVETGNFTNKGVV